MKAVCIHSYGGPEVLKYDELPRPKPEKGEILVRVHAAGINPVDWKIREGHLKELVHHHFPLILGWDLAGTVAEIGEAVNRLKVGDAIYSRPDIARDGAYAEYIVLKESDAALKPGSIDFVQAASLPLASLTAWQSLIVTAGIAKGQRVLVHAAAGSVGLCAVQLCKLKGAYVVGTASAQNKEFLKSIGTDEVIDYKNEAFEHKAREMDVVFDTVGGQTQERSWATLKPGGILVSIGSPPSKEMMAAHKVRGAFVFTQPDSGQLAEVAQLVDAGKLKPFVGRVMGLDKARSAQDLSQNGHLRGKVILQVS